MKEPETMSTQETEVWWGGYSPWTMVPSLLLCVALTGLIAWWGWYYYVERRNVRLAILSLTGIVWTVQTLRFGYRFFGMNYHLTTHRLIQDWGLLHKGMRSLSLKEVAEVAVARPNVEEILGVGRIVIRTRNPKERAMVWKGVRNCTDVADRIRAVMAKGV